MGNKYKHDYDNVLSIVNNLKTIMNNYEDKITEMKNLINNISLSGAWVDQEVKTSFINCCNEYMSLYDKVTYTMSSYVDYLEKKSDNDFEYENSYMRGIK